MEAQDQNVTCLGQQLGFEPRQVRSSVMGLKLPPNPRT